MVRTVLATALLSAFALGAYAHGANPTSTSGNERVPQAAAQSMSTDSENATQAITRDESTNGQPASNAQPLETVRRSVQVTGQVVALDKDRRRVTLASPEGNIDIRVGDEVTNFDQLEVGKPASVRYNEAAVLMLGKETAQASSSEEPDQTSTSVLGKITDIDRSNDRITVETPEGQDVRMHADSDALAGVETGDPVSVTYTRNAAISVEPANVSAETQ